MTAKPLATFGWPAPACDALEALWNTTDLSAVEISDRLSQILGRPLSKSAIVGQVFRMREKGVDMKRKGPTRTAKLAAPKPERDFDGWPDKNGCIWPIGDVGEPGFRFCCARRGADRRYCAEHYQMAFREKPEKSDQPMVVGPRIGR